MGDPLNTKNAPQGCSNFLIPNCKNYKLQQRPGSDKDDFLCNECKNEAKSFSNNGGTLKLDTTRTPNL